MQLIDTLTFTSPINREYSSAASCVPLGEHKSTMTLHAAQNRKKFFIEWDIPSLEETYEIGIWCEGDILTDYDGLFSLPTQAVTLLRRNGITAPQEFVD